MFNLWPKNEVKEIIDNMPKFAWSVDPSFYIDEKEYTAGELVDYIKNLLKENKNLEDVLKSIEEDGTVEHNNAIKLREENVQLKNDIENYKKGNINWNEIYYEKIASTLANELSLVEAEQKAIVAANHKMAQELKEKNDRVILLENAVDRWSSRAKSWEKIDEELKSNISELTKEVVNLRHLKTENVEFIDNTCLHFLKERDELKSRLIDYQDKYAESFSYNDMNKLQKEIDDLKLMYKERESKLKTYNTSLLGQIAGLKEENEKLNLQVTALHKIIEGGKSAIDEQKAEIKKLQGDIVDYVFEKTEEQKHPMYPIHWGTLDPDIYEKVKNISIEEAIKDVVRAEVENEDPFEGIPKTFPNEFQDEETTSENLEEKFDKGEDVLDYFEKPWQCPCNMCKQEREENTEKSWEETASDLALKVIKLEKKIEELTTAK